MGREWPEPLTQDSLTSHGVRRALHLPLRKRGLIPQRIKGVCCPQRRSTLSRGFTCSVTTGEHPGDTDQPARDCRRVRPSSGGAGATGQKPSAHLALPSRLLGNGGGTAALPRRETRSVAPLPAHPGCRARPAPRTGSPHGACRSSGPPGLAPLRRRALAGRPVPCRLLPVGALRVVELPGLGLARGQRPVIHGGSERPRPAPQPAPQPARRAAATAATEGPKGPRATARPGARGPPPRRDWLEAPDVGLQGRAGQGRAGPAAGGWREGLPAARSAGGRRPGVGPPPGAPAPRHRPRTPGRRSGSPAHARSRAHPCPAPP